MHSAQVDGRRLTIDDHRNGTLTDQKRSLCADSQSPKITNDCDVGLQEQSLHYISRLPYQRAKRNEKSLSTSCDGPLLGFHHPTLLAETRSLLAHASDRSTRLILARPPNTSQVIHHKSTT